MNQFIQTIISEGTLHEFKSTLDLNKPKSWLKTISAFSNSVLGGTIYVGITDSHEFQNVEDIQGLSEKVSEIIVAKIDPIPTIHIEALNTENNNLLIIKVDPGKNTPYYFVDSGTKIAYIRMGEESIPAPNHILHSLVLKGLNMSFDSLVTNERIENHTFLFLKKTLLSRVSKQLTEEMLVSFGLVTQDGYLTNAGVLLSDECNLLQSRVFATRWNGLDKTTSRNEAFDSKEFNGNILYLLEESEKFVNLHNRVAWHKGTNSRIETEAYISSVIHEILVNALIHREYTIIGSEVHIDIFDDRLEVYNPGGMVNGILLENVDPYHVGSARRNPIIADVFEKCKLMEREGSGLKNILRMYKENPPKFFTQYNSFSITLMSALGNEINVPSFNEIELTEQEKTLLKYLKNNSIDKFNRKIVENVLFIQKTRATEIIKSLLQKEKIVKQGKFYILFKK